MRIKYLESYDVFVNEEGKVTRYISHGNVRTYTHQFCRLGYVRVQATVKGKRKTMMVHRLVAMAFIPNPNGKPDVNHKDSVKGNNHYSNLEWVTESENTQHAMKREGLTPPGRPPNTERNNAIKNDFHSGLTRRELCEKWGLQRPALNYILRLTAN